MMLPGFVGYEKGTRMRVTFAALWLPVLILALVSSALADPAAGGVTVLETASYWRVHAGCRDAVVPLDLAKEQRPDAKEPLLLAFQAGMGAFGRIDLLPPPADWADPQFDDAAWFRSPGPVGGRSRAWQSYNGIRALLSIRGKFTVNDPAAVTGLSLSLAYRGGAVVYLNGVEVARGDLPEGKLAPATPGAIYPREAYADAEGKLITNRSKAEWAAAEAKRNRQLGPVVIPPKLLRKGVNVLAIEIHRSDFRLEALQQVWNSPNGDVSWPHIQFRSVGLTADAAAGAVVPNVSRPKGVQVWNQDPHRIFGAGEYGDPNEPLRPIRLVGARNGSYSGQVVVASTDPLEGFTATAGELTRDGGGTIPAANVTIGYPQLTEPNCSVPSVESSLSETANDRVPCFLSIQPEPPATINRVNGAAVQPVWVTVGIPKDAAAGIYKGTVTIAAAGLGERSVPVEAEVIGWALPAPKEFRTYMGIYESPETLAIRYGVPLWSDKHWALIERSIRLLGELGNKLVVIPLVNRTQFGNDESWVPWIKGNDGTYRYDWTVHDKMLDLYAKYCEPQVISYQVWTAFAGGYHKEIDNAAKPLYVTVVDPATSTRESMRLPAFGTDESMKLWRPLMEAVRDRLKQRGLEKSLVLGSHTDNWIQGCFPVSETFKAILPAAGWHCGAHNRAGGTDGKGAGGVHYVLREYMYVPPVIPDPRQTRRYGWANPVLAGISQRLRAGTQPPMMMHTMAERGLCLGDNGAGRIGLDYWTVKAGRAKLSAATTQFDAEAVRMFGNMDVGEDENGGCNLYGRWPESTAGQRNPHFFSLARPGKDGAVHTVYSMMMREGVQECQARIAVEQALVGKDLKITGDLAGRAQKLLDARTDFCRIVHLSHGYGINEPLRVTHGDGWQKAAGDLYALAAEVAESGK